VDTLQQNDEFLDMQLANEELAPLVEQARAELSDWYSGVSFDEAARASIDEHSNARDMWSRTTDASKDNVFKKAFEELTMRFFTVHMAGRYKLLDDCDALWQELGELRKQRDAAKAELDRYKYLVSQQFLAREMLQTAEGSFKELLREGSHGVAQATEANNDQRDSKRKRPVSPTRGVDER
jgi:hypothetical protein